MTQILHDAPEAHQAKRISFGDGRTEPAVSDDDQQQGALLDRATHVAYRGTVLLRGLRFLPGLRKHTRRQSGLASQQFGLRHGQRMVVLADESFRRRQLDGADRGQALFVIDGDDFEILHIMSRGSPAGCIENALHIRFPNLPVRVECGAARVSLPHDVE